MRDYTVHQEDYLWSDSDVYKQMQECCFLSVTVIGIVLPEYTSLAEFSQISLKSG